MSADSGVASIITISRLAWSIYRSCKDAPKDFKDISEDVSRMHIVLKETDELVADLGAQEPIGPEKLDRLKHLANGCRDVLNELEELLGKFRNLGGRNVGLFDRLRFAKDDVDAIRDRIVANTVLLTAFNTNLQASSQARLEQKLDRFMAEVRAGLRDGSVISSSSWAVEDQEIWRQLQRELEDIGIPTSVFQEKKEFIATWFQRAILDSGELQALDPFADGNSDSDHSFLQRASLEDERYYGEHERYSWLGAENQRCSDNVTLLSSASKPRTLPITQPRDRPLARRNTETVAAPQFTASHNRSYSYSEGGHKQQPPGKSLLKAVQRRQISKANELLEKGCDMNYCDSDGRNSLMIAVRHCYREIVLLLLQKGADVDAVAQGGKYRGWTALHYICMKAPNDSKATGCISLLLSHGANTDMATPNGSTPLLIAANYGPYHLVRILLDNGADTEARTKIWDSPFGRSKGQVVAASGWTALHLATFRGEEQIVRALLDCGADAKALTHSGQTALDLVPNRPYYHRSIAELLINRCEGLPGVNRHSTRRESGVNVKPVRVADVDPARYW